MPIYKERKNQPTQQRRDTSNTHQMQSKQNSKDAVPNYEALIPPPLQLSSESPYKTLEDQFRPPEERGKPLQKREMPTQLYKIDETKWGHTEPKQPMLSGSMDAIFQRVLSREAAAKQQTQNPKTSSNAPLQKKENKTGLPDNLKSGIENLSGFSMDDVKVHYNSSKPAQLQAHAYAQGSDIHIASGQEKHLPHEAWHVVQQKQGRVKPTMQMKGVNVNDDVGLEREADRMGRKTTEQKILSTQSSKQLKSQNNTVQLKYKWSAEGDDGVLIGKESSDDPKVLKFGGFTAQAPMLDKLSEDLGLGSTNSKIVKKDEEGWDKVTAALTNIEYSEEGSDENNREKDLTEKANTKEKALIMDFAKGDPLTTEGNTSAEINDSNESYNTLYKNMGKLIVMDLVTRNNDRFPLTDIMGELGVTDAEKVEKDNWHYFMQNPGNVHVERTGNIIPIDSQYTSTPPREEEPSYSYIDNIINFINSPEKLIESIKSFLQGASIEIKDNFETKVREGITEAVTTLKSKAPEGSDGLKNFIETWRNQAEALGNVVTPAQEP